MVCHANWQIASDAAISYDVLPHHRGGGALGGVFVALIAPRVFTEFSEYPVGLAAACLLGFTGWLRTGALALWTRSNFAVRLPLMALLLGGITSIMAGVTMSNLPSVASARNFYGILRVMDKTDRNGPLRELRHGTIRHGIPSPERATAPGHHVLWPAQRRNVCNRTDCAGSSQSKYRDHRTRRGNHGGLGPFRRYFPVL